MPKAIIIDEEGLSMDEKNKRLPRRMKKMLKKKQMKERLMEGEKGNG